MQSFFVPCGREDPQKGKRGNKVSSKNQNTAVSNEGSGFRREIGLFGGVSIIGGIMIGSGIFYLGSYVLQRSGMSMGLSLIVWILGGLISLMGGLCYAELGASMPKAGGNYVYLNEAYHPAVGFMCGFSSWLLGGAGSIAAIAIAFPKAFSTLVPISDLTVKLVAIGLIILLTAINYVGVKQGSIVQNIFMVAKVAPILLILVLGIFAGKQTPDLSPIPASSPSIGGMIGLIAFAIVASLWAYEGWTNLNIVSEEIRNPKKNLPLALIIAIVGCTVLFTLFNFAVYRVLPIDQITSMIEGGDIYLGTEVANTVLGSAGQIVVVIAMATAIFGSLNGCILVFPRQYYAMAKDGYFFKSFAKLHPKHKTPAASLIVQAIISIALVLVRDLDQLTNLVIFSSMLFNTLTIGAVFIFRKKMPDLERPYKAWGYPVTVVITLLIFIGLMINTLVEDPVTSIIGLAVPALGFVCYHFFRWYNSRQSA